MDLFVGVAVLSMATLLGCGDPEECGDRVKFPDEDAGVTDAESAPQKDAGDATSGPVTCADVECHPSATCNDAEGDATCECMAGFEGDGMDCADIDECEDPGAHDCDENAVCINRTGSFSCRWREGFFGDGRTCADVDECEGATNTCHPDAQCSNDDDGIACECDLGFSGDGFACADVDECSAGTASCGGNEVCVNTRGDYACECGPLYAGEPGSCRGLCEVAQEDSDLCDANGNGRCEIASDGTASCTSCLPGFVGDGQDCTADSECAALDCGPNSVCDKDGGSAACACAPGYEGDASSSTGCSDVDECEADPCTGDEVCVNAEGGYLCECAEGLQRDGGDCVNIDECADSPGVCDPNATCTDRSPGFDCECKAGYEGNGITCRDVDECASGGSADCLDDGTANCVNTAGDFECACKVGYEGDGVASCDNIDECADATLNDCDDNATCTDRSPTDDPPFFECACNSGFTGDGTRCSDPEQCKDSTLNDCDEYADCTELDEGYECSCQSDFAGDGTACHCDLSGFWAMRQDVHTTWPDMSASGATAIEAGMVKATVWELHRYDYDGSVITVQKKGCGSDVFPETRTPIWGEIYSFTIPQDVFDSLDLVDANDVDFVDADPGDSFVTGSEAALVGIRLDDPLGAWPSNRSEVGGSGAVNGARWVDDDSDGVPGLTLWPRSTLDTTATGVSEGFDYVTVDFTVVEPDLVVTERAGCVSVGTRVITHLDAAIDASSCNTITGSVINEGANGRFRSCALVPEADWDTKAVSCTAEDWASAELCTETQLSILDDSDPVQSSTATFDLIKLGDLSAADIDCQAVRDALPAISRTSDDP